MKNIETKILAHRGAKGLVKFENTIEAFEKAIELKADIIELDLRKTLDDVIIINHDPHIAGKLIKDHSYAELEAICQKRGHHLATLEEVLVLCQNKITLDIEFKEAGYEKDILATVFKYLKPNEFYVRSFNDNVIKTVKNICPAVYAYLLVGRGNITFKERLTEIFPKKRMKKCLADGISPLYKIMILGFIKRMHRSNIKISVWTVDDPKLMKKLMKKGVDSIVTNYPDVALKIRKSLKK